MVRVAAFALDLLFLAGGFPVAMLLARLTTGSAWPWATALLWLSGAVLYGLGLRLSPLKATLAQDLLGLRNRTKVPGQAAPGLEAARISPAGVPCPRCGLTHRRDCRFCKACGTPLAPRLCPACSKTAAPDARFCKSCGRPLS